LKEFDVSEITVRFFPQPSIHVNGLTKDEQKRCADTGYRVEFADTTDTGDILQDQSHVTLYCPYWFVNAGREAALNISVQLVTPKRKCFQLPIFISLMAKEKVKFNFLVDASRIDFDQIHGKYELVVEYSDIYANRYHQAFAVKVTKQKSKENSNQKKFGLIIDLQAKQIDLPKETPH
jgi:hypothetical protein